MFHLIHSTLIYMFFEIENSAVQFHPLAKLLDAK